MPFRPFLKIRTRSIKKNKSREGTTMRPASGLMVPMEVEEEKEEEEEEEMVVVVVVWL